MNLKVDALATRYLADKAEALSNIENYIRNSAGIGEHPNIIEELDKLVDQWTTANDKYEALKQIMDNLKN
tara:strand:- start:3112 stop:3321 length:210 start_codon:yes stop_codon:yes gene_type:complete